MQAAVAVIVGCLLIVAFHLDAFAGQALIPHDATADNASGLIPD